MRAKVPKKIPFSTWYSVSSLKEEKKKKKRWIILHTSNRMRSLSFSELIFAVYNHFVFLFLVYSGHNKSKYCFPAIMRVIITIIYFVKLAIVVEGGSKAPFSIPTTTRCRGGRPEGSFFNSYYTEV